MGNILKMVFDAVTMVSVFLIPFILARTADILFAIVLSKKLKVAFKWSKLRNGLLATLLFTIGIMALTASFAILPELISRYNVDVIDLSSYPWLSTVMVVVIISIATIKTYGRDAVIKLMQIMRLSDESKKIIKEKMEV